jgi:hypothetical protein
VHRQHHGRASQFLKGIRGISYSCLESKGVPCLEKTGSGVLEGAIFPDSQLRFQGWSGPMPSGNACDYRMRVFSMLQELAAWRSIDSFLARSARLGRPEQLDELAHVCGNLSSRTLVFFWRPCASQALLAQSQTPHAPLEERSVACVYVSCLCASLFCCALQLARTSQDQPPTPDRRAAASGISAPSTHPAPSPSMTRRCFSLMAAPLSLSCSSGMGPAPNRGGRPDQD